MWRHITDLRNTSDGVVLLVLSLFAPFSVFNKLRRTVHVYLKTNRDRSTGTKKLTAAAARRTFHHTILCEAAQDVVRDAGETAAAAPMVQ